MFVNRSAFFRVFAIPTLLVRDLEKKLDNGLIG